MELEGKNTYPSILEKNIHEIAKIRTYKKGEKIFSEGEALEDIYLIKSGIVKLTRKKSDEKTPILMGIFKDNQFVGELNLEDRSRISRTTATMLDRGELYVLCIEKFKQMLNQDAQLGIELTKKINTLLLRDQSKIRDMIISDKKGALYSILIRLSNSFGEKIGNNIKIKLYLKHHELGQMVGLTRETVTRFLLELKSLDVVSSNKEGLLVIHDINYLRKMSKCENCGLDICQM